MTERKRFDALVKSIDMKQGIVTSVVAVFGNVDAQNERILPGAFTKDIQARKAKMQQGKFVPVVYGHKDEPHLILGKVIDLRETSEGLEVDEQYFLHKQAARDALDAHVEGVLGGSSFAYNIRGSKRAPDGVLNLTELEIIEVGPTMYPANDATRLIGVKDKGKASGDEPSPKAEEPETKEAEPEGEKAVEVKAGRTISSKNEAIIQGAIEALQQVLSSLGDPQGKTDEPQAKVEDPVVPDANARWLTRIGELSLGKEEAHA